MDVPKIPAHTCTAHTDTDYGYAYTTDTNPNTWTPKNTHIPVCARVRYC